MTDGKEQVQPEVNLAKDMQNKCKLDNNNEGDFDTNRYLPTTTTTTTTTTTRITDCGGAGSDRASSPTLSAYDETSDFQSSSGRSSVTRDDSSPSTDEIETFDHKIDQQQQQQVTQTTTSAKSVRTNLVPTRREVLVIAEQVRLKFLESLNNNDNKSANEATGGKSGLYDSFDIEELRKELPKEVANMEQSLAFRWISRFIKFNQIFSALQEVREFDDDDVEDNSTGGDELLLKIADKEINEAVKSLKNLLKFRNFHQVSYARSEQFAKEFFILSGMFVFGRDKQDLPVIYLRARMHRKWSPQIVEVFRRYVAWQVDTVTKSYSGAKVSKSIGSNGLDKDGSFGICFDCLSVSYACLDMEFLRFLVSVLVDYYPTYCRYCVCVDLPWLFRSVWNIVKTWLPEEARNSVHLITSKELTNFIDEDQIPNCIKVNDLKASEKPEKNKHQRPINWNSIKGIDGYAEELNISSNELKQFKKHVEKIRKEYEELGAV